MFIGEEASLNAINATGTIIAPKPIKVMKTVMKSQTCHQTIIK